MNRRTFFGAVAGVLAAAKVKPEVTQGSWRHCIGACRADAWGGTPAWSFEPGRVVTWGEAGPVAVLNSKGDVVWEAVA